MTDTPAPDPTSTGAEPGDPAAALNDNAAHQLHAADAQALDAADAATKAAGLAPSAATAQALTTAAYGYAHHAARLMDAHNALTALHTTRDGTRDLRCRTCRTPQGNPAPWPCETLVVIREAMGFALPGVDVERLRDWGRIRNGTPPRTDWGRHTIEHCRAGHR